MEREPPMVRYHTAPESEARQEAPIEKTVNRTFEVITWVILAVVLAVWAFVGALFWIPLLLRAMILFSVRLVQSVFVAERPEGTARVLRDAVTFYKRGFIVAIEVVTKAEIEPDARDPDTGNLLLSELFWAAFVWYFILLWLGWIQYSPLDLGRDFWRVPWGEMWDSLVNLVRP